MKFLKRIICFIACIVGFVGSVNAVTLQVSSDTVSPGATRNVTIELVDDSSSNMSDFNRVEFQLDISGTAYASIEKFEPKSTGMTYNHNQSSTGLTTYSFSTTGSLPEATIGVITYKTTSDLTGDFNIALTNVRFYKADNSSLKAGDSGVKVVNGSIKFSKPKSTEALLTELNVSQGELNPAFSSEINEYTVQVKDTISSIKITANSSAGSTRTGTGTQTLQMGANEFEVVVTAEDGTTKNTYKITVIRGDAEIPSAYLKSLDIDNIGISLSPKFEKTNDKYTVNIGKNISELNFVYEREDSLAEVTIEGNENFKVGENKVTITVVSSDGEQTQVYEITVIKDDEETEEEKPVADKDDDDGKDKKKNYIWMIAIIGGLVVAIVIGVTILLFKKKKKKKDKPKEEEEEQKLPLKKRAGDEPTYETEKIKIEPSSVVDEEESVTAILRGELFDEEKTQKFDSKTFKEAMDSSEGDDGKTKEFNFKDFN